MCDPQELVYEKATTTNNPPEVQRDENRVKGELMFQSLWKGLRQATAGAARLCVYVLPSGPQPLMDLLAGAAANEAVLHGSPGLAGGI